jgi:hypothetical protein
VKVVPGVTVVALVMGFTSTVVLARIKTKGLGVGQAFLQTREQPDVADSAWAAIERFFRTQLGR